VGPCPAAPEEIDEAAVLISQSERPLLIAGSGLYYARGEDALTDFARTFSVLSRTGVPVLQALDIVAQTSGNALVSQAVIDVQAAVRRGESLASPLERHEVFPPMVTHMMAVGEETGALDAMLGKVADFYDNEVDDTVTALTSLIEPLLIIVMGVVVGGILISLYLPMFNIANLINN